MTRDASLGLPARTLVSVSGVILWNVIRDATTHTEHAMLNAIIVEDVTHALKHRGLTLSSFRGWVAMHPIGRQVKTLTPLCARSNGLV